MIRPAKQHLLRPFFRPVWYNGYMRKSLMVQQDRVTQRDTTEKLVVAKRRRPVTARDKEAIIQASAVEGLTQRAIAEKFNRSEHTIRSVLRSPKGKARIEEIYKLIGHEAKAILRRNAKMAAEKWVQIVEQSPTVERIKDYKAARDLLTHAGVIDIPRPKKDTGPPEIIVQISCGSPEDIIPTIVEEEDDPPVLPEAEDE